MKLASHQNSNAQIMPSFKMKIRLASDNYANNLKHDVFSHLAKREEACWPFVVSKNASSRKKIATKDACDCNVLLLTNGIKSHIFHLIPSFSNMKNVSDYTKHAVLKDKVVDGIQKTINNLKKSGKKVEACITGGLIFEQDGRRSISMFKGLAELLSQNKIEPSVLWGQCGSALDIVHFVKNNELILYPSGHSSEFIKDAKNAKDLFYVIKLQPQDEIWLNNVKHDANFFRNEGKSVLNIKQTHLFNYE